MTNQLEWDSLKELVKMKNDNPAEYKKLLEDIAEIMCDISNITQEVAKRCCNLG